MPTYCHCDDVFFGACTLRMFPAADNQVSSPSRTFIQRVLAVEVSQAKEGAHWTVCGADFSDFAPQSPLAELNLGFTKYSLSGVSQILIIPPAVFLFFVPLHEDQDP